MSNDTLKGGRDAGLAVTVVVDSVMKLVKTSMKRSLRKTDIVR
jgi:hypothetical protein